MEILHLQPDQLTRQILNIWNELSSTKDMTLSSAKRIIDNMSKKNQFVYCMYEDGTPVGVATLVVLEKPTYKGENVGLIEDVVITKKYRNKGYGLMLVKFLCEKAKRNNCRQIRLICKPELCDFYAKAGFSQWSTAMRINLQ